MSLVKAKKHLGQHFLTDKGIASRIVDALQQTHLYQKVLEVGPGMGILTDFLLQKEAYQTYLIDIDSESILFLQNAYPQLGERLIHGDFLKMNFEHQFEDTFAIIGNFPYNISSQILFKILDYRHKVVEMVGMFQKEVAQRCAAQPHSKDYGILSVLLQTYYHIDYLFTVKPGTFNPPPKVNSGVIRITRNATEKLDCHEKLYWRVVKAGFNQRRKTLRNALSVILPKEQMPAHDYFEKRAEQLSIHDFIALTQIIEKIIYSTKAS